MFKTLLLAGALLCLSFTVAAQECEFPFDATVGELSAAGAPPVILQKKQLADVVAQIEALTGQHIGKATRGFMAAVGGKILLGLEVDGCLIPPIVVGETAAPKLSGRNDAGEIGA